MMTSKGLEAIAAKYHWPLRIRARGYVAILADVQGLNGGEKPMPIYRFPGGLSLVSESEMIPA